MTELCQEDRLKMAVENSEMPYGVLFHGVLIECATAEEAVRLAVAIRAEEMATRN
jgi:hypothetical protein